MISPLNSNPTYTPKSLIACEGIIKGEEMEKKKIWFIFEDPNIYDGYCATVYRDGSYELRDHWAVDRLSEGRKDSLKKDIERAIEDTINYEKESPPIAK